jgi:hypothetical protein
VHFVKVWTHREGNALGLGAAVHARHLLRGTPNARPRRAVKRRLHHRFNAPVGNKPYERNDNVEHDRDPGLNEGERGIAAA